MLKPSSFLTVSIALFLLILGAALPAAAATLLWDPPSSGEPLGYILYYGTSETDMSNSRNLGPATSCDLDSLPLEDGVLYYIGVSAFDADGEGPMAGPLVYTPGEPITGGSAPALQIPSPPSGLRLEE